jgi:hypothetical protein
MTAPGWLNLPAGDVMGTIVWNRYTGVEVLWEDWQESVSWFMFWLAI